MLRTIITKNRFFCLIIFLSIIIISIPLSVIGNLKLKHLKKKPGLVRPVRLLYSHKRHQRPFRDLKIECLDCHHFSIKSVRKGPLAIPVKDKFLKPRRDICHECHLGRVSTPRRHQCTLCHIRLEDVKPRDHFLNWKYRHGNISQFDQDSCTQCHKRSECSNCHLSRDHMKPEVHRGNFRFTHSIEARARPHSCVKCHQSLNFCTGCHSGRQR